MTYRITIQPCELLEAGLTRKDIRALSAWKRRYQDQSERGMRVAEHRRHLVTSGFSTEVADRLIFLAWLHASGRIAS